MIPSLQTRPIKRIVAKAPPAAPANVFPLVAIAAPIDGSNLSAPALVNLSINASDPDGTVASVIVKRNGATLPGSASLVSGTSASGVWGYTETNVPAGTQVYTAVVTDNLGAVTISVPITQNVIAPATTAPITRVQVNEIVNDGPNFLYACKQLQYSWNAPGGDWSGSDGVMFSTNHYASYTVPTTSKHRVDLALPASLLIKLIADNTAFYIHPSVDHFNIRSREQLTDPIPTLVVVTANGTYPCPLLYDLWLDASSSVCNGTSDNLTDYVLMKFDFSSVVGVPTSGGVLSFTLNSSVGNTIYVDYLETPRIVTDPAKELGGQVLGLRASLGEAGLAALAAAADPRIITHSVMDPAITPTAWDNYSSTANMATYKTWPQYNMGAVRVMAVPVGDPLNSGGQITAASWYHRAQPVQAGVPYSRDYGAGYDELWLSYPMMIDADLIGKQSEGVKLPGLAGFYAHFPAEPNSDFHGNPYDWTAFDGRMHHSSESPGHPGIWRFGTHWYDATHPVSLNPSNAEGIMTAACFKAGRIAWLDEHVKMNTFNAVTGLWNHDGVYELFMDGVCVYFDRARYIRGAGLIQIEDVPFFNVYQGGFGNPPYARIHWEIGTVIVSTVYIGPPATTVTHFPTWRTGLTDRVLTDIPNTKLHDLATPAATFGVWNGLALDYVNARWYSAANGGHGADFEIGVYGDNGVYGIDFKAAVPGWYTLRARTDASLVLPNQHYYLDGRPTSRHSYYFHHYVPSMDAIVLLGCPVAFGGGISGGDELDAFSIASGDWIPQGAWNAQGNTFTPAPTFPPNPINWRDICACQDRRNGDIYEAFQHPTGGWGWWGKFSATSPTTGGFTQVLSTLSSSEVWNACGTEVDTKRNLLIALDAAGDPPNYDPARTKVIRVINLASPAIASVHVVVGLEAEPHWYKSQALTHDTKRDKYITASFWGRIYEIDATQNIDGTYTARVIVGSDTNPDQGPYNRLTYIEELSGCVYAPSPSRNVQFLPLDA